MHGPLWLNRHNPLWTSIGSGEYEIREDDPEEINMTSAVCPSVNPIPWFDKLSVYHSSWRKLVRATAWILRFGKWIHKKSAACRGNLLADELKDAERIICSQIQQRHFAKELTSSNCPRSSPIYSLRPFLGDDGLLHVGGRTGQHPIILHHDSPATILLIRHFHEISHAGVEWSLSLLRERFWVTKGRRVMKSVIGKCVTCKRLFAKPATQLMADLPLDRISPHLPPFSHVGVDAFGPMLVTRRRSREKRYGCLFTCFVTRAIHLEVVESLDSDSFLNAFRRFVARRGPPVKRNFVAGDREGTETGFLAPCQGKSTEIWSRHWNSLDLQPTLGPTHGRRMGTSCWHH